MKDKSYVALAYMTGILPVKKYGTHSALNMFDEYSMTDPRQFAEYVGFTETEVKELCGRYQMDFDEMKSWYDGYSFDNIRKHGQMINVPHVYNPKSVVAALLSGHLGDYWTRTETYEALKVYIDKPAMIIELKYDKSPDEAIQQIKKKKYTEGLKEYQNNLLLVGINYDRKTKKHQCTIEKYKK